MACSAVAVSQPVSQSVRQSGSCFVCPVIRVLIGLSLSQIVFVRLAMGLLAAYCTDNSNSDEQLLELFSPDTAHIYMYQ